MFKRLNTGGSELSPQEVRNCSARLFGARGIQFYEFLTRLAKHPTFVSTTDTLAEADLEKRGREELVLRFFAAKNGAKYYSGHVANWLDSYIEAILVEKEGFDMQAEEPIFTRVFDRIAVVLGEGAFCKYKDDRPIGGLAPAHYEAIAIGFANQLQLSERADTERLRQTVTEARQSPEFRENVGPGANKKSKLQGRITVVEGAIQRATQ
jgi:hypothetical protein